GGMAMLLEPTGFASQPVDGAVACGGDDPAGGARRCAGGRPSSRRLDEGILDALLGQVDVSEHPDEDCDGAPVVLPEHALDAGLVDARRHAHPPASFRNGRTSTGSVVALAALRAQSSAASRSGARMIQMPPMCSFPSANGPSVVRTSSPVARTTVAVLGA